MYNNGQRAFLVDESGSGQVYYPNGKVAVVIARSDTENGVKFQRYFYDDDRQNTLLCSIDEHAVGCAMDNTGNEDGYKFISTRVGGILSSNKGRILNEWKWDRNAQDAGTLPSLPLKVRLNHSMEFTFNGKDDIVVDFRCEGLSKDFQCGEQLRRRDTYHNTCKRRSNGKLEPRNVKTLMQRQEELTEKLAYLRNLNRPASENVNHAECKQVVKKLEDSFQGYAEKIVKGDFGQAFLDPEWKVEARVSTMREVPRIFETGQETGKVPERAELGGVISREEYAIQGSDNHKDGNLRLAGPLPKKWETELDTRLRLRETNPILKRSFMLSSASGRYSTSLPVQIDLQGRKKFPECTPKTFDQIIGNAGDKVVVIVCLREDDGLCVNARQLFEMIHHESQVHDNQNESRLSPCSVYEFPMANSRYLTNRFGVHTLPAFLMFYNGRLVKAAVMGGKSRNLVRENGPPRILLVEPTKFQAQLQAERLLKKYLYESELAISVQDAVNHIKYRSTITSPNAVTFYGIVLIDSDMDPSEASQVISHARRTASNAERGYSLIVSMLPMGSIPQHRMTDGVVNDPTREELIDNICEYAITRPLKSKAMEKLQSLFLKHQMETRGPDASEPQENETHYGFKKADIVREINHAYADGKQNRFLDPKFKLGMRLPANRAIFRGVRLEHTSS